MKKNLDFRHQTVSIFVQKANDGIIALRDVINKLPNLTEECKRQLYAQLQQVRHLVRGGFKERLLVSGLFKHALNSEYEKKLSYYQIDGGNNCGQTCIMYLLGIEGCKCEHHNACDEFCASLGLLSQNLELKLDQIQGDSEERKEEINAVRVIDF